MVSSGRLEKLVSRCVFRRLSHDRLSKKDWAWKRDTVQWLLATKVAIEGRDSGGVTEAIDLCVSSIVVWKTYHSKPIHLGDLLNAACGVVVAHKGKMWVIEQLPSASSISTHLPCTRVERPDLLCDDGETHETITLPTAAFLPLASYCGDRWLVQSLLENGADPNAWSQYFGNAMYAAAYSGHADIVCLLVDAGADMHHTGTYGTPLEVAARQGHVEVMRLLLNREASGDFSGKASNCLLYASGEGREEAVRFLLVQPTLDVNPMNCIGQTPLLLASQNQHRGTARLLLGRLDIQPNISYNGYTSLLWVAIWGWADIVQLLLARQDIDPNPKATSGNTPLAAAAKGGHEEIARLLISRNDVQPSFAHEFCPLWLATINGHARILELLLQRYKVKLEDYRCCNMSLLWWGAKGGNEAVVRAILARDDVDPNYHNDGETPLFAATSSGHHAVVEQLLARVDVNPNIGAVLGTPLQSAVLRRDVAMVRSLLRRQDVEPNKIQNFDPPLLIAARWGQEEIVRLFLDRADIDPNIVDWKGETPLYNATVNDHQGVVQLLLTRDDVDPNLAWPLRLAARFGSEAIVRLFLARSDVDLNRTGIKGTPLWQAALFGHEAIVRLLLERPDIHLNVRSRTHPRAIPTLYRPKQAVDQKTYRWGWLNGEGGQETSLCVASRIGAEGVVRLLLKQEHVSPNMADSSGRSPLWWAASKGHAGIVQMLLDHPKAHPGLCDATGWTALLVSANEGYEVIVEKLLKHPDTDPNIPNEESWTPLLIGANNGDEQIVELLLQHPKINPDLTLDDGRTALMLARNRGHDAVARFLTGHMANKASAERRSAPHAEVGL